MLAVTNSVASHTGLTGILLAFDQHLVNESGVVEDRKWVVACRTTEGGRKTAQKEAPSRCRDSSNCKQSKRTAESRVRVAESRYKKENTGIRPVVYANPWYIQVLQNCESQRLRDAGREERRGEEYTMAEPRTERRRLDSRTPALGMGDQNGSGSLYFATCERRSCERDKVGG